MNRLRALTSHMLLAIAEAGLIALLAVGLIASTAFAAKPTGGAGGAKPGGGMPITVVTVVDRNLNGLANWADTVHFTFTTSNPYPTVSVTCTQNGGLVFADSHPYYWPNVWDDNGNVILSSPAWTGGAADCQVTVKGTSGGKTVNLGSATFHVDG
ncbi:MAG: hypothetical protein HY264_03635 [Chloroflexi bacterium]|nr:hypothetical protein [Chloroflexota bacterium]